MVPRVGGQILTLLPFSGYAALHELFHINSMAHRVAYRVPHVYDRRFEIYSPVAKKLVTVSAYGAEYTKTLARWTTNTGWWVATNGMWIYNQTCSYHILITS